MKPTFLRARTLALPLLLALAAMIWLVTRETESPNFVAPGEPTESSSAVTAELEGAAAVAAVEVEGADVAPLSLNREFAATGHEVHLRVALTTVEDQRGSPPRHCEGWPVVATTSLARTNEITRYTAFTNADGVAEFFFPTQMHLNRVFCLPPLESHYAVTSHEEHAELERGESFDVLLHLGPAFSAAGKVIDLDGQPVAGAVVHAESFGLGFGLMDWQPGLVTAMTDPNGIFQFDQLSLGLWTAAVEPRKWLMIEPALQQQNDGNGILSFYEEPTFENPKRWDFGTLQVMPVEVTLLTVHDGNGQAASGLYGYMEPLQFNEARLITTPSSEKIAPPQPREMLQFLAASPVATGSTQSTPAPSPNVGRGNGWPYDDIWFLTDSRGQAALALPDGSWRLHVFPPRSFSTRKELPTIDFRTGSGHLEYQIVERIGAIQGRLVVANGSPAKYADLYLHATNADGSEIDFSALARKDGSFEFPALKMGMTFSVSAIADERYSHFIATQWQLEASLSQEKRELVVAAGLATSVRFTSQSHDLDRAHFRLRAIHWFPKVATSASDQAAWWGLAQNRILNLTTKPLTLPRMPAGSVEYAVLAPVATGTWNVDGSAQTTLRAHGNLTIQIGEPGQTFALEFPDYQQPQSSIAVHHGVILDQVTGETISQATISLWDVHDANASRETKSDVTGRFHTALRSGAHALAVTAPGYAPRSIPERYYPAGEHEHEILMEPLLRPFTLQVLDRDGLPVPACTLTFPGISGTSKVFLQDFGLPTEVLLLTTKDRGRAHLIGVPPGPHALHIDFWGAVSFDLRFLAPQLEGQTVPVRLPLSLEELRLAVQNPR